MRGSGARLLRRCLAALALLIVVAVGHDGRAAPTYPPLTSRVTDAANLLDPETEAALTADLAALEQKSTDQLAVVTVPSLEGYSIEDYGIGLGRTWGIGQKGKDNGVLLIVAPNERKVRIEVGRKLEPFLTDTMSALIIHNAIIPAFRRGDWAGGIKAGVRDITDVILGDAEEVKRRAKTGPVAPDYVALVVLLIFFGIVAYVIWHQYRYAQQMQERMARDPRFRRAQRSGGQGPVIVPGGSGDWGGGWSGSGSGGGWSGGGGDFGGGGASGGW